VLSSQKVKTLSSKRPHEFFSYYSAQSASYRFSGLCIDQSTNSWNNIVDDLESCCCCCSLELGAAAGLAALSIFAASDSKKSARIHHRYYYFRNHGEIYLHQYSENS